MKPLMPKLKDVLPAAPLCQLHSLMTWNHSWCLLYTPMRGVQGILIEQKLEESRLSVQCSACQSVQTSSCVWLSCKLTAVD